MEELIALYLQVPASDIKSFEEWGYIFHVVVKGKRATFVSKRKVLNPSIGDIKIIQPVTWLLTAETRRQEYSKKWVARILGTCKRWGLRREFLQSSSIKWGKVGIRSAEFEISEPGYYQDSDGDYFKAWVQGGEIETEICSSLEVKYHFGLVEI